MPRTILYYLLPGLLAGFTACQSASSTKTLDQRSTPPAPLRNTRWVLRQLGAEPVTTPENGQEPYLLLRADQAQAEGNGGCNRFSGSFEQPTPEQLRLGPLRSTRMACPALDVENRFTQALSQTAYYRIAGDTLRLYAGPPAETPPLARLQAVYTQ